MEKLKTVKATSVPTKQTSYNEKPPVEQKTSNNLFELLPQVIKFLPQIQNFFTNQTAQPENTKKIQPAFSESFFQKQNKQAVLNTIKKHNELMEKIKNNHP